MGRSPCCSKVGLRRGPWSTKEDDLLTTFILENGEGQWRSLPKKAGLLRCGKSCRLRWMNYLRPGIKRGNISEEEEDLILRMHRLLGNRWSLIAGRLPGRTDNEIKNYWNTHVLKKLQTDGIRNKKETSPSPKKKKKRLPGKAEAEPAREAVSGRVQGENTKLYLPKPIRVSPAFSRTSSCDSLASGGSIGSGVADVGSCVPWASLFELEEACGGCPEDFLGTGSILPLPHQGAAGDVGVLEQVYYDEYLQLLSSE